MFLCRGLLTLQESHRFWQNKHLLPLSWYLIKVFMSIYLEIGKVFSHEAVDLTDRQTSCFAVLQGHKNQDAAVTKKTHLYLGSQSETTSLTLCRWSGNVKIVFVLTVAAVKAVKKAVLPVGVNGLGKDWLCAPVLMWLTLDRIFRALGLGVIGMHLQRDLRSKQPAWNTNWQPWKVSVFIQTITSMNCDTLKR